MLSHKEIKVEFDNGNKKALLQWCYCHLVITILKKQVLQISKEFWRKILYQKRSNKICCSPQNSTNIHIQKTQNAHLVTVNDSFWEKKKKKVFIIMTQHNH